MKINVLAFGAHLTMLSWALGIFSHACHAWFNHGYR